jgi:hypothetical protein
VKDRPSVAAELSAAAVEVEQGRLAVESPDQRPCQIRGEDRDEDVGPARDGALLHDWAMVGTGREIVACARGRQHGDAGSRRIKATSGHLRAIRRNLEDRFEPWNRVHLDIAGFGAGEEAPALVVERHEGDRRAPQAR